MSDLAQYWHCSPTTNVADGRPPGVRRWRTLPVAVSLVQRFSGDYAHFVADTLTRLVQWRELIDAGDVDAAVAAAPLLVSNSFWAPNPECETEGSEVTGEADQSEWLFEWLELFGWPRDRVVAVRNYVWELRTAESEAAALEASGGAPLPPCDTTARRTSAPSLAEQKATLWQRAPEAVVHADRLVVPAFAPSFPAGFATLLPETRAFAHRDGHIAAAVRRSRWFRPKIDLHADDDEPLLPVGEPHSGLVISCKAPLRIVFCDRDVGGGDGAALHAARHVVNSEEMLSAVDAALRDAVDHAFATTLPGMLTVDPVTRFRGSQASPADTVALFSTASAVFGAHGACLGNTVWSPAGTVVAELIPANVPYNMYGFSASQLGHAYYAHVVHSRHDEPMTVDTQAVARGLAARVVEKLTREVTEWANNGGQPGHGFGACHRHDV